MLSLALQENWFLLVDRTSLNSSIGLLWVLLLLLLLPLLFKKTGIGLSHWGLWSLERTRFDSPSSFRSTEDEMRATAVRKSFELIRFRKLINSIEIKTLRDPGWITGKKGRCDFICSALSLRSGAVFGWRRMLLNHLRFQKLLRPFWTFFFFFEIKLEHANSHHSQF